MPPAKFSTSLYDFVAFLETEKNLSARTREAYRYDLERFMDYWLERRKGIRPTLDKITTEDIRRYLEDQREKLGHKSTTLSRTIASIRIFFEFCVREGLLRESPAAYIHNPKLPRRLPIFLIEGELKRLLQVAQDADKYEDGSQKRKDYLNLAARDYAILVTFGFTGLRLSELVGVNLDRIDFVRRNLRVLGKGAKERIVPLNDIVVRALEEWIAVRSPADEDENAVFLSRFGRRISTRGVEKMVERHVSAAGITKDKISPHKLRHTFATLLHMSGVDIVEIQALMGHATITSTQIYTHADSARLHDAVGKLEDLV